MDALWQNCMDRLENEIPAQEFNTWIRPLQAQFDHDNALQLFAPNPFVRDWVNEKLLGRIQDMVASIVKDAPPRVLLSVGSCKRQPPGPALQSATKLREPKQDIDFKGNYYEDSSAVVRKSYQNRQFTFANFVEGKSNQLARAAAQQVAQNPGKSYNPLFIYGGVGLGKTHLMHAAGNLIQDQHPEANVVYVHSERFVADMVKALQHNSMNEFKRFYRSADALLIDDIQFFAKKDRSQEEFFHTFNALFDSQTQIVMTCDRYPKEIEGVEERLKSRFGWGLTVSVEPPELETRVAILMNKAEQSQVVLNADVAFFIAKHIQSNVRELEGALKRVMATAHFTGQSITQDFAREALKDLLAVQAKQVTLANIQKTVAEHYKIKLADLLSKRRNRSVARPRQMAMALAKALTNHSLPEIGDAFSGRDHTTVLHACRRIEALLPTEPALNDDFRHLLRVLST